MQFKQLVKLLIILTLGLFANASYATGEVTRVSVPYRNIQGTLVTVTLNGRGTCGSEIYFGDRSPVSIVTSRPLPHRHTHRYRLTGNMTIYVRPTRSNGCVVLALHRSTRIIITPPPDASRGFIRKVAPNKLPPHRRLAPRLNKQQRSAIRAALTCGGRRVTIVGTPGNDVLIGTPGYDVIHGLGGNDIIRGGGGNDVICGGHGNDMLYGGPGNDWLHGGPGNDGLIGGSGDDKLFGGNGRDHLRGELGNDMLIGGDGNDMLIGGDGNDQVWGGNGNDTLDGEGGNDKLYGERGNDILNGRGGNDRLYGGDGYDRCSGGPGSDWGSSCEVRKGIP